MVSAGCSIPGETTSDQVSILILDEFQRPTAARLRLVDMNGDYLAPIGHQANFPMTTSQDQEPVETDVILDDGRRFAYVSGSIMLPEIHDSVSIEVVKGFHYRIYRDTLLLSSRKGNVEIQLEKAFKQLPDEGWYTGDVHVHHINTESALLQIQAEDLNVCNLLISDFTLDHQKFRGSVEPTADSMHLIYYNQEYREDRLGHVNLLNLTSLIEPAKEQRQHQYPLNIDAMDQVHNQGGHVSWAHFAAWPGLEGPLAVVLKKIDAVELLCTIDPFHEPIFVSDVVPELPMNSGLKLWYRLLNCGFRIPVTAGTDKMGNFVTVGANRTYAQVTKNFNYQNWIEALNQGRTFVSNSPFLSFKVNKAGPGSIFNASAGDVYQISAEVWSQMPLDRLEIIANGELLAEISLDHNENYQSLEISFEPTESTWITARAYQLSQVDKRKGLSMSQRRNQGAGPTMLNRYFGTLRPEVAFAHTSPVYIEMNGAPVRSADDARYFVKYLENAIDWLDQYGSFPSDEARKEVLEAFEAGKRGFQEL
ncbi:MAG: hypothetical protein DHS20C17_02750 [Cyclobacteriaceae bacterium]|nr:MAG: hypothetical protein DHS20C17_02750 [Cyclobacteriaceae bacterium]